MKQQIKEMLKRTGKRSFHSTYEEKEVAWLYSLLLEKSIETGKTIENLFDLTIQEMKKKPNLFFSQALKWICSKKIESSDIIRTEKKMLIKKVIL